MSEARDPRLSPRLLTRVRLRVTALATLAVVAVLVVAGFALVASQRRQLVDRVDEAIEQRVDELTADLETGDPPRALVGRGTDTVAQVVASDGTVIASSPALAGAAPIADAARPGGPRTVHGVPLDDGTYRLVSRRVDTRSGPVTLLVAGSLDDEHDSTAAVSRTLFIGIPLVAVALGVLLWVLVGRLLEQVATATSAHQRFVADASHELRTPLARMRAELEVDHAHPETSDPGEAQQSLIDETIELQHLVDDLLLLARSDAGQFPTRHELVDLDVVVAAECRAAPARAGVTLDTSGVEPTQVRGDSRQLARAFRNVLENAIRHADSSVRIALGRVDNNARLAVDDDGPGIPSADRQRIFERFTRLDEARGVAEGGSGLGLAITREIIEHHGGRVSAAPAADSGTSIRVVLPLPR